MILVVGCTAAAAQTTAPAPPPIGVVLREMPPDLWHFISWDTGAVLGIGGVAAGYVATARVHDNRHYLRDR